jgi:hypothetical protein
MPQKKKGFFDFGRLRVDPIERVLLAEDDPVSLTPKSEAILPDMLRGANNREEVAVELAITYAALGENDPAFYWLEKAYLRRAGGLILFNAAPEFESLSVDQRFYDLGQRVGLPRNGENGRPSCGVAQLFAGVILTSSPA